MKQWFAAAAMILAGCASSGTTPGTPPSPAAPWVAPATVVPAVQRAADALPDGYTSGMPMTLSQVIDLALTNNPATRTSWLEARAAEAALGSTRSENFPEVDLSAPLTTSRQSQSGSSTAAVQTTFAPSVSLTYLLFDFGGRAASIEAARQTLIATNFAHNQTIQDVVLRAQQTYYSYLDAKALRAAQAATVEERQKALDAAEARHRAGVATIADVLQARTALSQARLTSESIEGNVRTIEGALATIMGLPATASFNYGELPLEIPAQQVTERIDALISRAVSDRPDLASARAIAERARVRVQQTRAQYLPTVGVTASAGETLRAGSGSNATPYSAGVALRVPLFTGWRNVFDVRRAETDAAIAREDVRALEQQVNLQVWTSYYALQTAQQRVATARDLLSSAQQSVDVAASRYRAGVGSILDLLTAEAALESARAQEVQSRTDWFLSLAQLAHDTGSLESPK